MKLIWGNTLLKVSEHIDDIPIKLTTPNDACGDNLIANRQWEKQTRSNSSIGNRLEDASGGSECIRANNKNCKSHIYSAPFIRKKQYEGSRGKTILQQFFSPEN